MAVGLLGVIVLAVAAHHGSLERSPFEDGLLSAVRAYERTLAVLGLGLAVARLAPVRRWLSIAALAAGSAWGIAGESDFANSSFVASHLYVLALPGPILCILAGVALALSAALQDWIVPALAGIFGVVVGLAIGFAAPAGQVFAFVAGGTLAGLWIVVAAALIFPFVQGGWVQIVTRILGSWLIAIGIMLGGVRIMAAKPALQALPPAEPATAIPEPSAVPQALPPTAAPRLFKHGHENDFGQP